MPRDEARTIKVRCASWDQVEAFYTVKLKNDTLLVKMPVAPEIGDGVTVALGLPNGLVFAIDGSVTNLGAKDPAGKWPVAMKMHGLTKEVRARLERLVEEGRNEMVAPTARPNVNEVAAGLAAAAAPAPAAAPVPRKRAPTDPNFGFALPEPVPVAPEPRVEDVAAEERGAFEELERHKKRITQLPAHEVLGVPFEAAGPQIREAYFMLARAHHPDIYGRYRSPALRQLASEVFIHINRAYDRLRSAAAKVSGANLPGPALRGSSGWLVGADDVQPADDTPAVTMEAEAPGVPIPFSPPATPRPPAAAAPRPAAPAPAPAPTPAATPSRGTPARDETPFDTIAAAGTPPPVMPAAAAANGAAVPASLADQLFGDLEAGDAMSESFDAVVDASTARSQGLANAGRAALAAGQWETARGHFASALKIDQRNRAIRALYHVASGMSLRQKGEHAQAQLQFETALGHDPECADALRALGKLDDKDGIFRRLR